MEKNIQRLTEQMKEQFHAAFYDVIARAVATEPPNYEYIVRLYTEVRDRIAAVVRPHGPSFKRIHEDFDVEFFDQLLRTNNFSGESMLGLINTTFGWIAQLQTPKRDSELEAAKQRVIASGTTIVNMVPAYIREVHTCMDWVEEDLREFIENKDHPIVQEMLRQAAQAHQKK